MTSPEGFVGQKPAWCPGCGNFGILKAFTRALSELAIAPHEIVFVSGIGQAGKFPHYLRCNTFNGLHGRTLPVATGIRLANHAMRVAASAGDGDCYGEGGNHLIHAIRRNVDVKLFVHDNQVYGLTKGQASPTSQEGMVTVNQPRGVLYEPLNPLVMAVALDCSWVGRGFSGDIDHLVGMIKLAFGHRGFTLLDILQPCVSFNRVNTHQWYRERTYRLEPDYDPGDRSAAFQRCQEWGERIPLGVLYRHERPTLEERVGVISRKPLVQREVERAARLAEMFEEFY